MGWFHVSSSESSIMASSGAMRLGEEAKLLFSDGGEVLLFVLRGRGLTFVWLPVGLLLMLWWL